MSRRFLAVLVWGAASWCSGAWAETIHLKDGRTIEAQIIRQTDETVTVDWYGVPLTYWRDGIVGIDKGQGAEAPSVSPGAGAPLASQPPAAAPSPAPAMPAGTDEPALASPPAPVRLPETLAPIAPPVPQREPETWAVFESPTRGARVAYPGGWAATVPDGPSPYVVVIQPKSPEEQAASATPPPGGGDGERTRARGGPPPARGQAPVVIELLKYAGASGRFGLEAGSSSDALADRFLATFTESGGRVLRKEPLAVQGGPGWLVEAEGTDPIGVTHHLLIGLAAEDDVLAALFCQAPPRAFEAYRALCQEVINRFEPFVYVPGG
ncbi:MAG: hypothetical protein HYT90_05255 [Candidatus Omnitrophica bacterium]|nr:hypothetical protein [Candidatus Omnitrophota bacterium]